MTRRGVRQGYCPPPSPTESQAIRFSHLIFPKKLTLLSVDDFLLIDYRNPMRETAIVEEKVKRADGTLIHAKCRLVDEPKSHTCVRAGLCSRPVALPSC